MQTAPLPPSLEEFVDSVLARAQLEQLDPRHKQFDVARGTRGTLHIITQKKFRDGRLVREARTTLCRGTSAAEIDQYARYALAPNCRRCQEVAERIILRRKARRHK